MKPCEMLCPKCGSLDVHRAYKEPGPYARNEFYKGKLEDSKFITQTRFEETVHIEHIEHHCRTCQYAWRTRVFNQRLDVITPSNPTVMHFDEMEPELSNLIKKVTDHWDKTKVNYHDMPEHKKELKKDGYVVAQALWIERCHIKVGDTVRVLRKADDFESDWNTAWDGRTMNLSIKNVRTIVQITSPGDMGIQLDDNYYYPFFVLEKVDN